MNQEPAGEKGNEDGKRRDALRLANVSSIGIALVLCTFIGYWFGSFMDRHFHTAPVFMIIFLLLGIAAGIINVVRTLEKFGK